MYLRGRAVGWGSREGSTDRLRSSFCPFPVPWSPFSHPTPSWLAQLSSMQTKQQMCVKTRIPASVELLAFRALSLLSGSQMTPEGLLAKVCSLDFVFSPSALPSPCLLALAPAPAPVCPCKH